MLFLAAMLGGCSTLQHGQVVANGPGLEFDPDRVKIAREAQDRILRELYLDAGLPANASPANANEWRKVIEAGMDFADRRCEEYLHALFRLNRDKKTTVSQIGLLGAATAGVLGALEAAAKEIAVTAIAFGLAASTVENLSSNVLYELEPSSVRTIVRGLQTKYKESLPADYDSRPAAVAAIRGYSSLCIPANIESEVNLAVKKSEPEAVKGDAASGRPPVVTHASVVTSTLKFGENRSSGSLTAFVFPGGVLDKNNAQRVQSYLQARGIQTSVQGFISGAPYAEERDRAVQFFGLK